MAVFIRQPNSARRAADSHPVDPADALFRRGQGRRSFSLLSEFLPVASHLLSPALICAHRLLTAAATWQHRLGDRLPAHTRLPRRTRERTTNPGRPNLTANSKSALSQYRRGRRKSGLFGHERRDTARPDCAGQQPQRVAGFAGAALHNARGAFEIRKTPRVCLSAVFVSRKRLERCATSLRRTRRLSEVVAQCSLAARRRAVRAPRGPIFAELADIERARSLS